MSDQSGNGTVQLEAGEEIGECENCGLVLSNAVRSYFPVKPKCGDCGGTLKKVKILRESKEVKADVIG